MATDSAEEHADAFEPETDWERLIERMARLKADLDRLQQQATFEEVPFELKSGLDFFAGDFDTLCRELIAYQHGDEMPDECPVCGEPVTQIADLEAGRSYDVERMCVSEKSADGIGEGIVHFSEGDDGE